jgi:hypothetical protein
MLKNTIIVVAVGAAALGAAAGVSGLNALQDPLLKACSAGASGCTVAAARFLEKQPDDDRLIAEVNALLSRLQGGPPSADGVAAVRILGAAIKSGRARRHVLRLADALEGGGSSASAIEPHTGSSGTFPLFPHNGSSSGSSGQTSGGASGGTSGSSGSSGQTSGGASGGTSGTSGESSGGTSGGTSGSTSGSSGSSGDNTSGGTSGGASGGTSGTSGESSGGTSGDNTNRGTSRG